MFGADGWARAAATLSAWQRRPEPESPAPAPTAAVAPSQLNFHMKCRTLRLFMYEGYSAFCRSDFNDVLLNYVSGAHGQDFKFQMQSAAFADVCQRRAGRHGGPATFVGSRGTSSVQVSMRDGVAPTAGGPGAGAPQMEITCAFAELQVALCDRLADALELLWDLKNMYNHFSETHSDGQQQSSTINFQLRISNLGINLMDVVQVRGHHGTVHPPLQREFTKIL